MVKCEYCSHAYGFKGVNPDGSGDPCLCHCTEFEKLKKYYDFSDKWRICPRFEPRNK